MPIIDPSQYAEIAARYRAGDGLKELSEHYRCSTGTIHRVLVLIGVPRRPKGNPEARTPIATTPDAVVARYRAGETLAEIGQSIHRSPIVVRQMLTDAGIHIRPQGGSGRDRRAVRSFGPPSKPLGQRRPAPAPEKECPSCRRTPCLTPTTCSPRLRAAAQHAKRGQE